MGIHAGQLADVECVYQRDMQFSRGGEAEEGREGRNSRMKVQFSCVCGKKFSASSDLAGKAIRCAACSELVEIPAQAATVIKAVAVEPEYVEPEKYDALEIPDLASSPICKDDLSRVSIGYAPISPAAYSRPVVSRPRSRARAGAGGATSVLLIIGITFSVIIGLGMLVVGGLVLSRMDFSSRSVATNTDGLSITVHPDENSRKITAAEAVDVTQQFVEAVRGRNVPQCGFLFDTTALLEKAISDVGFSSRQSDAIVKGFDQQNMKHATFTELTQVAGLGEYEVVNPVTRQGEQRVICRLSTRDGRLNYHEFMFCRDAGNQVKIRDMFVFQTGESLGTSLRNIAMLNAAAADANLRKRLSGEGVVFAKHANEIKAIYDTLKFSPTQALQMIRRLPTEVRDHRAMVLLELKAAGDSDIDALEVILDKMQATNANDPSLSLQRFLLHNLKGETELANVHMQRLDSYVGGDPFLQRAMGQPAE